MRHGFKLDQFRVTSLCYLVISLFALILASPGWGASTNCYVATTGNTGNTGLTPAQAKALPSQCVTVLNAIAPTATGAGQGHNLYIAPGAYTDAIGVTDADMDGSSIIGVSDLSTLASAAAGQIAITASAASHGLRVQRANVAMGYLTIKNSATSYDTFYYDGSGFTGTKIRFMDAGRYLLNASSGTTFTFNGCDFMGSAGNVALTLSGSSSGTFNYCRLTNSPTNQLGTYTTSSTMLNINSTGDVTFNNGIIMGGDGHTIAKANTGTGTINNSVLMAGDGAIGMLVANRSAGTLVMNNNIEIQSWRYMGNWLTGTITDNNYLRNHSPKFKSNARAGYIIPCVDDSVNAAYALDVAELLQSKSMAGTFYVDASGLAVNLANVQAVQAVGSMEIGFHAYSNTDLSLTGTAFSITKADHTLNVDRANNQIVVEGASPVTVTGFKAKTLTAIRTELTSGGCTLGSLTTNLSGSTLGEALADSSGAQASPYNVQLLIDTSNATGLFKTEIADAKASIETALGTTLTTMAGPMGFTSTDLQTAAQNSGVYALRNGSSATGMNWRLNNIDLYKLLYIGSGQVIGASDDETRGRVRAVAEMAAQTGAIVAIVGHNTGEISLAQWSIILDTLAEYSGITVTSMASAVNAIRTSGLWAGSGPYTRAWTDTSDYSLQSSSPCRNAGLNTVWSGTANVTDYAGKRITDSAGNVVAPGGIVDIGAYEFKPIAKGRPMRLRSGPHFKIGK